ncbi:uncharacterized protein [Nicotiana sylvestris]|uniref:uncharacterized protein n=1 Tax=Nicotiana sylvestris TaxID=4096 RepID=UPI00388CA3AD
MQKPRTFTPLGEAYTTLFHKLKQIGLLSPVEAKLPNPLLGNLNHSVSCEYCSGAPRHDTEKCWKLKTTIQDLIDTNRIEVQAPGAPNINENPLPVHHEVHMVELVHEGGKPKTPAQTVMMIRASTNEESTSGKAVVQSGAVYDKPFVIAGKGSSITMKRPESVRAVLQGVANKPRLVVKGVHVGPVVIKPVIQLPMTSEKVVPWNYSQVTVTHKGKKVVEDVCEAQGLTRSGRCFAPAELRRVNLETIKKPVTGEEAEEFLKRMKAHDYSIIEQLRKTPAQISLLSLLIHSNDHCQALMKILNEAYVPDKLSVNHLEKVAPKIFEANRVTFSDDELPVEGTEHNMALYMTVKCEESVVTRALFDNESSANICPLATLNKLKVADDRIHQNSVCVRGFDGGGINTVGL